MSKFSKQVVTLLSVLLVFSLMFAGCNTAPATTNEPAAEAPAVEEPAVEAAAEEVEQVEEVSEAAGKTSDISIALLDGSNGNAWRAQMESEMSEYIDELKAAGVVSKYTAYSANDDATTQSQQMSQLINGGETDVILVNPVSATSLNPMIDKAIENGILVLGIDQVISHGGIVSVTTDQAGWARIQAEHLVNELGGKGNIVIFNGIAGYPASDMRTAAYHEVLDQYPDITILKEVDHDWDEGKAKQLMLTMLSAYPQIDGILNQECSPGIISAYDEAGVALPKVISSDESINYLRLWSDYNKANPDSKLNGIIVANPPGIGVTAIKVAVQLMAGNTLNDEVLTAVDAESKNALLLQPNLVITNDNLDEWIEQTTDAPETYTFSNCLSDEEIAALFE
ncbi:MAG: substrate-binding domain-containing protein [Anaerolineaceae bacterium]|nr:substrate-binding domain-containing protein [Anaerolineaceae bacterium]